MTKRAHTTPPPDAAARRKARPVLTYSVEQLPSFDAAFYNRARAEVSKVAELTVPPREAKAFEVSAGHFFRIVSVEGPQVGDLNLWNPHDLTERFYSGKTRALHATHLSTGFILSSLVKLASARFRRTTGARKHRRETCTIMTGRTCL